MALKDVIKRMRKKIKQAQRPDKMIKWQRRLEIARTGQDLALMDKREYLYLGDRTVDKNVNASTTPSKKSNNIYNIVYEFIESQVSQQIPEPQVKAKREGFDQQAQMIADSIANDMKESEIDEINDRNERTTPIQGFSVIEVVWDPDFKHHLYRGEIKLYDRHPKQFIGQPKIYSLQKMDYFFILSNVTKDFVLRRYGIDMTGEEEQFAENTRLSATEYTTDGVQTLSRSAAEDEEEALTEIVCWYKDKDGDIGKYVWINDTELEDLPKFFYRRDEKCIQCGEVRPIDEEGEPSNLCYTCGGTTFEKVTSDTETLDRDVQLADGTMAQAGEEVPYFVPTRYPVSIRINVPQNFHFGGQSDVDVIRDQQDSIKRVVHKMEEKLVKGGTIIKALDDHTTFNINDTIYQIVRGTAAQLAALGTEDLTADIQKDIEYVQEQYKMAQSMLGITNSYQGKEDPTAQSGKAKQIQVQQASGRLQSKMFNKYVHFKEIFEIMFEFKLALYDETRPYLAQDANGQDVYGEFDKYKLLMRDKAGKLYYNTDFIFTSDGSFGLPKDPMFIYNQALALFQAQAIDAMQLMTILESLQFPQAAKLKEQLAERMQQQQQTQQLQQENEQLSQLLQQADQQLQTMQQQDLSSQAEALKQANEHDKMQHQKAMDYAKMDQQQQKLQIDGLNALSKADYATTKKE